MSFPPVPAGSESAAIRSTIEVGRCPQIYRPRQSATGRIGRATDSKLPCPEPNTAHGLRLVRENSAIQLVSQVVPTSVEKDCSHRAVVAVISDHTYCTLIGLPS